MSEKGYTYTTLSGGPGEPVRVTVSFYLDDRAWIRVPGIEAGQPVLSIEHGDVLVRFGPAAGQVTGQDARIARTLAGQAAIYAAEIERLSAAGGAGADAA
ncbi:MAG TPA: hypothetical protein VN840_08500 [Streptosporangiaceae bacterium]|nr:hypothetical protein [Streptosporangiaceae bacterium]